MPKGCCFLLALQVPGRPGLQGTPQVSKPCPPQHVDNNAAVQCHAWRFAQFFKSHLTAL
jgi:hypothetical protein